MRVVFGDWKGDGSDMDFIVVAGSAFAGVELQGMRSDWRASMKSLQDLSQDASLAKGTPQPPRPQAEEASSTYQTETEADPTSTVASESAISTVATESAISTVATESAISGFEAKSDAAAEA
ncbi:hypothetical protein ACOMHN_036487 [Nucella lapillus]